MGAEQAKAARLRRLRDSGVGLDGFQVEALDGSAGRINQVLYWNDALTPDYVIVGLRSWFFGRESVISVADIQDIDVENRRLRLSLSKEQIRQSPEFLP